ncbi:MAG: hypothetical protein JXR41_14230 [Bacteroidales bacterium]|nr:hypothetical protein [Bacteroidales bacterium]
MMKRYVILLLTLVLFITVLNCKREPEKIIGVKIYEYEKDFDVLISKWKDMGINTAFVSKELAENSFFRQLLKENNIKTFLIFPVFYDPERLDQDSALYSVTNKGEIASEDWVEFVCPSRKGFRKIKAEEAAGLVRELQPDGLSIDFIRTFVFWEMIYPDRKAESIDIACFCDSCTGKFCKLNSIVLPDTCLTVIQKAAYILNNHSETWDDYRTGLIASMVKDIAEIVRSIKPDIKINVHAVPWRDEDFEGANISVAAQDMRKIAPYTDFISPMCYSQMVRRDAEWIESVVREMDGKAPRKILPSIQVSAGYHDDPYTVEDFRNSITSALGPPSRGVVFFSWTSFEKDPARREVIRQ